MLSQHDLSPENEQAVTRAARDRGMIRSEKAKNSNEEPLRRAYQQPGELCLPSRLYSEAKTKAHDYNREEACQEEEEAKGGVLTRTLTATSTIDRREPDTKLTRTLERKRTEQKPIFQITKYKNNDLTMLAIQNTNQRKTNSQRFLNFRLFHFLHCSFPPLPNLIYFIYPASRPLAQSIEVYSRQNPISFQIFFLWRCLPPCFVRSVRSFRFLLYSSHCYAFCVLSWLLCLAVD
jgi:hypothetical protein